MYKTGDLIMYGPRLGYVIDEEPDIFCRLFKVYFFDVQRWVLLDEAVLSLAKDEDLKDLKHTAHDWCECGAKFVPKSSHSSWCVTYKFEQGDFNEAVRNIITANSSVLSKKPNTEAVRSGSQEGLGGAKK